MKKIDMVIIAAIVVAIAFGLASSLNTQSAPESKPITVSLLTEGIGNVLLGD